MHVRPQHMLHQHVHTKSFDWDLLRNCECSPARVTHFSLLNSSTSVIHTRLICLFTTGSLYFLLITAQEGPDFKNLRMCHSNAFFKKIASKLNLKTRGGVKAWLTWIHCSAITWSCIPRFAGTPEFARLKKPKTGKQWATCSVCFVTRQLLVCHRWHIGSSK